MSFSLSDKKFWNSVIYIVFFLIALLAAYFSFRNYDFKVIIASILNVKIIYLIGVFIISLSGSIVRAIRWKMLLGTQYKKLSLFNVFNALMFGYFVNLGTPRLGEISRCIYLRKKSDIPLSYSLPTIFLERVIDLFFLLVCVVLSFYLEKEHLLNLFEQYVFPVVYGILFKIRSSVFILISLLVLAVMAFWVTRNFLIKKRTVIHEFIQHIKEGFLSIFYLKNAFSFLVYSIAIWVVYFLTSYLWFLALDIREYSPVSLAFICMALGSIAKTLPIHGGSIGVYHLFISQILVLFYVSQETALVYATLNHGFQIFYNIGLGIFSLVFYYKKTETI